MAKSVSIGSAWSEAAAFARQERKLLTPLVLAMLVVPAAVSQLVQPSNPFARATGFQPWMAIAVLALLIGLAGQMAISRLAMGWHDPLGATIKLALKRLPATVAGLLLFFVAILLLLMPIVFLLTLLGGGTAAMAGLANLVALLALFGTAPRILFAPAIAMKSQLGPLGLIKASWRATRASYWRLLGFFALFLVASFVLATAATAVVGSIATLALGPPEPMSVSRLVMALVAGLVQAMIATVYAAMIGRMVVQVPEPSTSGT